MDYSKIIDLDSITLEDCERFYDDAEDNHITEKKVDAIKNKFVDKSDVF